MFGISLEHLIQSGGILVVALIVFAESGLLAGFFLPGDSLLFSAGFLASQGYMNLPTLIFCVVAAAIIGDNVGYQIGRRYGKRLFKKEESFFFHKDHITKAQKFYEAHGGKTIILARFVPMVRTFAPVVAGVGEMPYQRFMFFNLVGGIGWGAGITLLGAWLGNKIPNIDHYIMPFIAGVMVLSFASAFYHLLREHGNRQRLKKAIAHFFKNTLRSK